MMIGIRNRLFIKLTPVTELIINAIPNITNKASMASPFFFGYVCIYIIKKLPEALHIYIRNYYIPIFKTGD